MRALRSAFWLGYQFGVRENREAESRARIGGRIAGYAAAVNDCAADPIRRGSGVLSTMSAEDCIRWADIVKRKHLGSWEGRAS